MKKMLVVLMVVLVALMGVGMAAAQEPDGPRGEHPILRHLIALVAQETGLTPREILDQAREGKTLAEIITENGGSVEAIEEEIDEVIDHLLNTPLNELPGRDGRFGRALPLEVMAIAQEIADQADVNVQDVAQQIEDGNTLNEVIASYGLDANTVVTNVETRISERLDRAVENGRLTEEEAAERLASLNLTELLDVNIRDLVRERVENGIIRRAVLDAISDALDKRPREIIRELTEGQTLNDYITANGGDPAAITASALETLQTFVDERVADGEMTQEEADALMVEAEAKITEAMNTPLPLRPER